MTDRQEPVLHFSDLAATALAPVLWGTTYVVATELLPPDRPLITAVLRCLPAGLLLLLAFPRRPRLADFGRLLVLSALNIGLFQWLLFVGCPGGWQRCWGQSSRSSSWC